MVFDGVDDTISLSHSDDIDFTNTDNFSFALWVRVDSLDSSRNVVGLLGKRQTYGIDAYYASSSDTSIQIR